MRLRLRGRAGDRSLRHLAEPPGVRDVRVAGVPEHPGSERAPRSGGAIDDDGPVLRDLAELRRELVERHVDRSLVRTAPELGLRTNVDDGRPRLELRGDHLGRYAAGEEELREQEDADAGDG